MFKRIKSWLASKFKSRAQRDRERGYYRKLDPIAGTLDKLNEAFCKKYRRVATVREAPSIYGGPWSRLMAFYRNHGIPNPKELLMLLFPSEWLSEKLWPRWDPEDRNNKVAPKAGRYNSEDGIIYCADGRVVHKKVHVPGVWRE
jgi:hypothetical protein